MKHLIKSALHAAGYDIVKFRDSKVTKPIDESYLEIVHDPVFQASVAEVSGITLLDTARLANLWLLCRASNPTGSIISNRSPPLGPLQRCCEAGGAAI